MKVRYYTFIGMMILLLCCPIPLNGEQQNTDTALLRLIEQAENGDAKAAYDLAYVYENGLAGIEKNMTEAIRLYRLAAEGNYAPAQNYLGFCFYRGDGVDNNPDEALKWIQRAADSGDPKSFNNLGWLLLEGKGIVHDAQKAAYWFSRAAEEGVITAQCQLADLYKIGNGVPQDSLKADSLYHKAMKGGLKDAERKLLAMNHRKYVSLPTDSALNIGKKYYYDSHFLIAATLFETAVAQGNTRAKTFMGECYAHARGVAYDFDKALSFYYEAATEGDAPAQFIIAETIEMMPDILEILPTRENSTSTDSKNPLAEAAYWYDQAAHQGITNADQAASAMQQ